MKVIVYVNIKGGVGKTSVLTLSARAIAKSRREGKKVLLIDLDPNNTLGSVFIPQNIKKIDPQNTKLVSNALLSQADDLADFIIPSHYPNIDLLRSSPALTRVFPSANQLAMKLKNPRLAETYDYIFIDTPATYSQIHIMALQAADVIVSPINLSRFDYQPLKQLGVNISMDTVPSKLPEWRLFYNRVKSQQSRNQNDYMQLFEKQFSGRILQTKIPDTMKIRFCIDRKVLVGHGDYQKLRDAICLHASEVTGEEINPEENF